MANVGFLILFGLSCVLFSCEGQVYPPSYQNITFLPGSNATLKWTFVGDPSKASLAWFFTRRGGSMEEELAVKFRTSAATINNSSLPGVAIEPPATLILKNVDQRYNGKYRLNVQVVGGSGVAEVHVFIAVAPNVTINCSSPTILNEGDDFTCVCRGEGGNPPANVTWYKDGVEFRGTGKEEQPLILRNVDVTNSGTYKCVAQSHINATDEKSIEIIVKPNSKPDNTTLTPNTAVVGTSLLITCDSAGLPEPNYTISRNGTVVSRSKTYTISPVMESDAGTCTYICIALNKLGNDSACSNLTVVEPRPPTASPPSTKSSGKPSGKQSSTSTSTSGKTTTTKAPPGPCPLLSCIIPILCAFLVVLVIILCLVYRYKKKKKDGYSGNADVSPDGSGGVAVNHYELDGEPAGRVDNTYDNANPSGASGSKSKPPKNTLPPVYAAVDKSKKDGKPLYATLDTIALHSDNSKKKRDEERPGQSEYASIDFGKIGKADQE